MFDRFQIVIGHYVFCCLWHGGQNCPLYAKLCRISRYFGPALMGLDLEHEENCLAKEIYLNLCQKNSFEVDNEPISC